MEADSRENWISIGDMPTLLASLWLFVLLNILFRDIHELFRPGMLEEILAGIVNGTLVTDQLLLISGIVLEIPILMTVLPRVLAYRINRPLNIGAALLMIAATVAVPPRDLDDIWFFAIEIIALLVIIGLSWCWRRAQAQTSN